MTLDKYTENEEERNPIFFKLKTNRDFWITLKISNLEEK